MKYIDAEKLKELISQKEKEFMEKSETKGYMTLEYRHKAEGLHLALLFIDSLPDENNPEPYNPVYDEDYLNEKIAKATKSWEGVDVDKMLADCRGYEEKPSYDLEEAAAESATGLNLGGNFRFIEGFKAGAKWQKEQMLKDAVECPIGWPDAHEGDKVRIVVLKAEEE